MNKKQFTNLVASLVSHLLPTGVEFDFKPKAINKTRYSFSICLEQIANSMESEFKAGEMVLEAFNTIDTETKAMSDDLRFPAFHANLEADNIPYCIELETVDGYIYIDVFPIFANRFPMRGQNNIASKFVRVEFESGQADFKKEAPDERSLDLNIQTLPIAARIAVVKTLQKFNAGLAKDAEKQEKKILKKAKAKKAAEKAARKKAAKAEKKAEKKAAKAKDTDKTKAEKNANK